MGNSNLASLEENLHILAAAETPAFQIDRGPDHSLCRTVKKRWVFGHQRAGAKATDATMRNEMRLHAKGNAWHSEVREEETVGIGSSNSSPHRAQRAEVPGEINRLVHGKSATLGECRLTKGWLLPILSGYRNARFREC